MLIKLQQVLDVDQLKVVRELLSQQRFREGKYSAGAQARQSKKNLEFSGSEQSAQGINNLVMGSLIRHPVYLNAGLPRRIAVPFYCRYGAGMGYGRHIDDPIMGQGDQYRSDIAITLFLNSPSDYEGGELEIQTSYGLQQVKGDAGDGIMYPASSQHRVADVVSGERLVAVTWMQSLVPEPDRRELLYQLHLAKESLSSEKANKDAIAQIEQSHGNLIRMWSRI